MNQKIIHKIKQAGLIIFSIFIFNQLHAQTDADGVMMTKNNFCTGAVYNYSSWKNYWEGTHKRKYFYFNPGPSQVNPDIKTLTGLPNFPSYTSGHSTFSGAASTILGYIIPSKAAMFSSMADEASISRLYSAIHYKSNIEQGLLCGQRVGAFEVIRAKADGAD